MDKFDFGKINIGGETVFGLTNSEPISNMPDQMEAFLEGEIAMTPPEQAEKKECPTSPCPRPQSSKNDIYYEPCEDHKNCSMGDTYLDGQGRILDISMKLKKVCPNKRVALGIVLTERDQLGNEYPRGLKTATIPAHYESCCKDIPIASMRFVLPEDISVGTGTDECTSRRHFIARVTAHYIDTRGVCPR